MRKTKSRPCDAHLLEGGRDHMYVNQQDNGGFISVAKEIIRVIGGEIVNEVPF